VGGRTFGGGVGLGGVCLVGGGAGCARFSFGLYHLVSI